MLIVVNFARKSKIQKLNIVRLEHHIYIFFTAAYIRMRPCQEKTVYMRTYTTTIPDAVTHLHVSLPGMRPNVHFLFSNNHNILRIYSISYNNKNDIHHTIIFEKYLMEKNYHFCFIFSGRE